MTKKKGRPPSKKKKCESCDREISSNNFYNTNSVLSVDGKLSICKTCVKEMIDFNNIKTVYKVLQLLDIPFIYSYWRSATEKSPEDPWSIYIRIANSKLNEFKHSTWKDSVFEPESINPMKLKMKEAVSSFELTDEVIEKWGIGYKPEEYEYFERKYKLLKNNYSQKTAMHTEALLNYIRYRVKEEMATASGDVTEAKSWGALAKDAATAAKINPSQLSKADLSDGLSTFSELSQAVEREVDIIPILPRFKFRPNDALDFNIWCYVNYIRDMSGLPPCKYEDIYKFYDRRKQEYIDQYGDPYGIFNDEPTESNRENIKKFIEEDGG